MRMIEFLTWGNCCNEKKNQRCAFCWQAYKQDPNVFLNKDQMIKSLTLVKNEIDYKFNEEDDLLIVGGETYAHYFDEVDDLLKEIFVSIKNKMLSGNIRYFYMNTNLLYKDLHNVETCFDIFGELIPRIKFTTSYDVFGRFVSDENKELMLSNCKYLTTKYPELRIVVNTIMTKQLCEKMRSGEFSITDLIEKTGAIHINLLPYIIRPDDELMVPRFSQLLTTLEIAEKQRPGYFDFYYHDLNDNQNKILYEYHSDTDSYVECTAKYSDCGHNVNFKKVLPKSNKCFICAIRDYLGDRK